MVEESALRRILLALILLGVVGLTAELLLLDHTESFAQWVPLGALGAALGAGVWVWLRPARSSLRIFRGAMTATVAAGVAGLYLHLRGNLDFEQEMDPFARGLGLFWTAARGATPALAPGAMIQLGLLGLAYTFRHPAMTLRAGNAADHSNR